METDRTYVCMYRCFCPGHHLVRPDPSSSAAHHASLSVCEVARQSKQVYIDVGWVDAGRRGSIIHTYMCSSPAGSATPSPLYICMYVCMYMYIYIYMYVCICIYIYIYIYIYISACRPLLELVWICRHRVWRSDNNTSNNNNNNNSEL